MENKEIIDFRLRPPIGKYPQMFEPTFTKEFASKFKMNPSRYVEDASFETMLTELKEANVVKAVVPCRKLKDTIDNEEAVTLMEQYPELEIMPGVDLFDGTAIETIEKYCVKGKCKGITLEPGLSEIAIDANEKICYPIYEKCQETGTIIFLSFGGLTVHEVNMRWNEKAARVVPEEKFVLGNNPKWIDEAAKTFPKAKFVLAHGGYPYVTEICFTAFMRENIYIQPDFYFHNVPGSMEYVRAVDYIPDNMIYGSGAPIGSITELAQVYLNCGAKPENIRKMMYENAAKLLDLK